MRLDLFFLLGLCHGVLALTCTKEGPPGNAFGTSVPASTQPDNGIIFMSLKELGVFYSPPSQGTAAGVLRIENTADNERWVRLFAPGVSIDLRVEGYTGCTTNLAVTEITGAAFYRVEQAW